MSIGGQAVPGAHAACAASMSIGGRAVPGGPRGLRGIDDDVAFLGTPKSRARAGQGEGSKASKASNVPRKAGKGS